MLLKLISFPFRLLFMISGFVLSLFGSALTVLIGLGLTGLGVFFCLTLVGFFAGLPLILIGISTVLKGLI